MMDSPAVALTCSSSPSLLYLGQPATWLIWAWDTWATHTTICIQADTHICLTVMVLICQVEFIIAVFLRLSHNHLNVWLVFDKKLIFYLYVLTVFFLKGCTDSFLCTQFEDVDSHGTKVVIYNLWMNDDGLLELDFEDDDEVICSNNILCKHNLPLHILSFLGHINPIMKDKWCIMCMNNDFRYNSCANYPRKENIILQR